MNVLKPKFQKQLFGRCMASTIFGEALDSVIFISIAFIGILPSSVILFMIVFQTIANIIYETIFYPLTRFFIRKIEKLPEGNLY